MALLVINGKALPEPSKYRFPVQDSLGENTYNEKGVLFRGLIRQGVCAIKLAWMVNSEDAVWFGLIMYSGVR